LKIGKQLEAHGIYVDFIHKIARPQTNKPNVLKAKIKIYIISKHDHKHSEIIKSW
jgi:hypothetical protein